MSGRKNLKSAEHPFHITARTNNREWFQLDLGEVWEVFEDQLFFTHHAFGIRIHAFVLMKNHFHLLASDPNLQMSQAMRWLMTETSRELGRRSGRKNHLYGGRNYKCLIPNYHYFMHAYKYIYRNPVEAGACQFVEDYNYSTLAGVLGLRRMIVPMYDNLMDDVEGNLSWLNCRVKKEEWDLVRKALHRSEFKIHKTASNRPSELENRLI